MWRCVCVCMRVNMHKIIMIAQLQNNLQVLCKITASNNNNYALYSRASGINYLKCIDSIWCMKKHLNWTIVSFSLSGFALISLYGFIVMGNDTAVWIDTIRDEIPEKQRSPFTNTTIHMHIRIRTYTGTPSSFYDFWVSHKNLNVKMVLIVAIFVCVWP